MSAGFYTTQQPVDASYTDQLIISVALPKGNQQAIDSLRGALVLFMDRFGIHSSGQVVPAEAIKTQHRLNERKD